MKAREINVKNPAVVCLGLLDIVISTPPTVRWEIIILRYNQYLIDSRTIKNYNKCLENFCLTVTKRPINNIMHSYIKKNWYN